MSEMSLMADHLIVVGRGRLIADTTVGEFVRQASGDAVLVRTPDVARLRDALRGLDAAVDDEDDGAVTIRGMSSKAIGELASEQGVVLHELTPVRASLEEAFMHLTRDALEYHTGEREQPAEEVAV
jgi:ABC-2 type transport system ATP-binding protein